MIRWVSVVFGLLMSAPGWGQAYSGVDPTRIALVESPVFTWPEHGWLGHLSGELGTVSVVVYGDDASAVRAFEARVNASPRLRPRSRLTSGEAPERVAGDGWRRTLVVAGNVVVDVIREAGESPDLASRVVAALEERSDLPPPPVVRVSPGRASVAGSWADVRLELPSRWSPTGGVSPRKAVRVDGWNFAIPQDTSSLNVLAWDRFGRWAQVEWEPVASEDQGDESPP